MTVFRHALRNTNLGGTFPGDAFSGAILYCLLDAFLRISLVFYNFDISCRIQYKYLRADFETGVATRTLTQINCRCSWHVV
jgi:hypothetical protein